MHKIDTLDLQILSIFEWISPPIHKKLWILLSVHINDKGDTRTWKKFHFYQWILLLPINRLSPIIYGQLTGDKIFAGAQLY